MVQEGGWISEKHYFKTILDKYGFFCTSGFGNTHEIKSKQTKDVIFLIEIEDDLYNDTTIHELLDKRAIYYYNELRKLKILNIKNKIINGNN